MPRPPKPFQNLPETAPVAAKKPDWFRVRLEEGDRYQKIEGLVKDHGLATVCREARCPNIYECWNAGTATFMLMGEICTRACRFCHVKTGLPTPLDAEEPQKIAQSVKTLGLSYIVLTSVNRDELDDEGSAHFAATVASIKTENPGVLVETLTPDFRRTQRDSIQRLLDAGVDVLAHNIETVSRLVPQVRDRRCRHAVSLAYHKQSRDLSPTVVTKSSVMLGLGETREEVLEAMAELRSVDVTILTLGQYLQPSKNHHPVVRYWHPDEFKELEERGLEMGFAFVAAGPMVRSSYRAAEFFTQRYVKESKQNYGHL